MTIRTLTLAIASIFLTAWADAVVSDVIYSEQTNPYSLGDKTLFENFDSIGITGTRLPNTIEIDNGDGTTTLSGPGKIVVSGPYSSEPPFAFNLTSNIEAQGCQEFDLTYGGASRAYQAGPLQVAVQPTYDSDGEIVLDADGNPVTEEKIVGAGADRAVGVYATGSGDTRYIELAFRNDTGKTITHLTIYYDLEMWGARYDGKNWKAAFDVLFSKSGDKKRTKLGGNFKSQVQSDDRTRYNYRWFATPIAQRNVGGTYELPNKSQIAPGEVFYLYFQGRSSGARHTAQCIDNLRVTAGESESDGFVVPAESRDIITTNGFENGFAAWQQTFYGTITSTNASNASPNGNGDHDEFSNTVEYAFDLNPKRANKSDDLPVRIYLNEEGHLTCEIVRNMQKCGLTFTVQASDDLVQWTDIATGDCSKSFAKVDDPDATVEETDLSVDPTAANGLIDEADIVDHRHIKVVDSKPASAEGEKRFMRYTITLTP